MEPSADSSTRTPFGTKRGFGLGLGTGVIIQITLSISGILNGLALVVIGEYFDTVMNAVGVPDLIDFETTFYTRWSIALDLARTVLFVIPALSAIIAYHLYRFRWRRDDNTRCGICNYILSGLTIARCPECGTWL